MDISSILSNLLDVTPTEAVNKTKSNTQRSAEQYSNPRAQADTVSISEEARALFARKLKNMRIDDEQTRAALALGQEQEPTGGEKIAASDRHATAVSPNALPVSGTGGTGDGGAGHTPDDEKSGLGSAGGSANAGGAGGAGSGTNTDELQAKINDIASQLQQLNAQMASIASGPGTPEQKTQQTAPIQAKIQQLEAQLNELRNQLMQMQKAGA